jgi:hypothetical protein
VARRDLSGLHRGLWGLPSSPWFALARARDGSDRNVAIAASAVTAWRRWLETRAGGGGDAAAFALLDAGRFSHAITVYRLTVQVVRAELPVRGTTPRGALWWRPPAPLPPLSALARKALALAGEPGAAGRP